MILDIFPTRIGIWHFDFGPDFDASMANQLKAAHTANSTGGEIWNRKGHNIFDGSIPECLVVKDRAIEAIQEFIGNDARVASMNGVEIVREHGVEIMPHSDADFAHIHGAYFPMGPEIDLSVSIEEQANQYGNNGYAICAGDFRTPGGHSPLMPWEKPRKYWIKPHRGLFVAFDGRAVHFQKPNLTGSPFVQLLLNFNVEKK